MPELYDPYLVEEFINSLNTNKKWNNCIIITNTLKGINPEIKRKLDSKAAYLKTDDSKSDERFNLLCMLVERFMRINNDAVEKLLNEFENKTDIVYDKLPDILYKNEINHLSIDNVDEITRIIKES